jgi:hypothetical protein
MNALVKGLWVISGASVVGYIILNPVMLIGLAGFAAFYVGLLWLIDR